MKSKPQAPDGYTVIKGIDDKYRAAQLEPIGAVFKAVPIDSYPPRTRREQAIRDCYVHAWHNKPEGDNK